MKKYLLVSLVVETTLFIAFLYLSVGVWNNFYNFYFYLIPFLLIIANRIVSLTNENPHPKIFNYLITTVVFLLLATRPTFHMIEMNGWKRYLVFGHRRPCGQSSCTRDTDLTLLNADPPAVYNPRGWFPMGSHPAYDPLGTTNYVYCNYEEACRWADYHQPDEDYGIQGYYKLSGGCQLDRTDPAPNEEGFASTDWEDYPDPGRGINNGWAPCKLIGQSVPCPGQYEQMTIAREGQPSQKHFMGRRVCSLCSLYQNSELQLGTETSPPVFRDDHTNCAKKDSGQISVWCGFICPGPVSTFSSPLNSFHVETMNAEEVEINFIFSMLFAFGPLLSYAGAYIASRVHTHGVADVVPTAVPVEEEEELLESMRFSRIHQH